MEYVSERYAGFTWCMYDQANGTQYPLANHEVSASAAAGICPLGTRVLLHRLFDSNATSVGCGIRRGDGTVYITGNTPVVTAALIEAGAELNLLLDDGMAFAPGAGTGLIVAIFKILP